MGSGREHRHAVFPPVGTTKKITYLSSPCFTSPLANSACPNSNKITGASGGSFPRSGVMVTLRCLPFVVNVRVELVHEIMSGISCNIKLEAFVGQERTRFVCARRIIPAGAA